MISRRDVLLTCLGMDTFSNILFQRSRVDCAECVRLHRSLTHFCTTLRCNRLISTACLRALPTTDTSLARLAALILESLHETKLSTSRVTLPQLIKQRSQSDFEHGRISYVDGWMLSQVEVRIYAFTALLRDHRFDTG
jgi:hypothetical protein